MLERISFDNTSRRQSRRNHGLKLPILSLPLIALAVAASAAIVVLGFPHSKDGAAETKLTMDVERLNKAIHTYIAKGGDLTSAYAANDVLIRMRALLVDGNRDFLKTAKPLMNIPVKGILQSEEEAEDGQLRAAWDSSRRRFYVTDSGEPGIKQFVFGDTREQMKKLLNEPDVAPIHTTALAINYKARNELVMPPPVYESEIRVAKPAEPSPEEGEDQPVAREVRGPEILTPPEFSPAPGKYLTREGPFQVTLSDSNPDGKSLIRYSINGGTFQTYKGSIIISDGDQIRAYCASTDGDNYLSSAVENGEYQLDFQSFAGSVSGEFSGGGWNSPPEGIDPASSVVGHYDDFGTAVFEWGTPVPNTQPNSLRFTGATLAEVEPEELFRVGTLSYYNGTVYTESGADKVDLTIELSLSTLEEPQKFTISMDLHNTPNMGMTADENADFIHFRNAVTNSVVEMNGKQYHLVLRFGPVTANGFSTVSAFHAHESKTASVAVFGFFTEVPPATAVLEAPAG